MSKPALAAAIAMLLAARATPAADSLHHHAVVSGGGSVASGTLRLDYSIGQPVAGTVSNNNVVLHSGVLALFVPPSGVDDRIFRNGFDP
ncbi:hypothetical protein [Dokdonella sp.]|uniref:hypothetical protein n=1 Tax=Dokdonella sp. TaxID=2291710 RepID=UPI002615D63C|nr:hypothetical protein [Dokdonella sp.]